MAKILELEEIALENEKNGDLKNIFQSINNNFQALLTSQYARGRRGKGLDLKDEPLVEIENNIPKRLTLVGRAFAQKCFADYNPDKYNFINNEWTWSDFVEFINTTLQPNNTVANEALLTVFKTFSVSTVIESEPDENGQDVIVMSGVFYFEDPRIAAFAGNKSEYNGFIDLSGIFWIEGIDKANDDDFGFEFKKSSNIPKLIFQDGAFYWSYNGGINIPATGARGRDGDGGKIYQFIGYKDGEYLRATMYWDETDKTWKPVSSSFATPTGSICFCFETSGRFQASAETSEQEMSMLFATSNSTYTDIWIGTCYTIAPPADGSNPGDTIGIRADFGNSVKNVVPAIKHTDIFDKIGSNVAHLYSYMPYLYFPSFYTAKYMQSENPVKNGCYRFFDNDSILTFGPYEEIQPVDTTRKHGYSSTFLIAGFEKFTVGDLFEFNITGKTIWSEAKTTTLKGLINTPGTTVSAATVERLSPSQIESYADGQIVVTREYLKEAINEAVTNSVNEKINSVVNSICPIGVIQQCGKYEAENINLLYTEKSPSGNLLLRKQNIGGVEVVWALCRPSTKNFGDKDTVEDINGVTVPNLAGHTLVGDGTYNSCVFETKNVNMFKKNQEKYNGELFHTLTKDEMPRHKHSDCNDNQWPWVPWTTLGDAINTSVQKNGDGQGYKGYTYNRFKAIIPEGDDEPHNNMMPFHTVVYKIRVK